MRYGPYKPHSIVWILSHMIRRPRIHRPAHRLKANKSREIPRHLHFVDVETVPEKVGPKLRRQVMWYGEYCYLKRAFTGHKEQREWHTFETPGQFWDAILPHVHQKERHYLIAHNLKADARALHFVAHLRERGWALKHRWEKSNVRLFRWSKGRATLMIVDNMNWFMDTIEGIGEWVGVEKIPIDWDHPDKEAVKRRCHNDVLTMVKGWEWWLKTIQEHDWGNFGITATKQAWNMFLHKFYREDVWLHNSYKVCKLERASFKGARADLQHIGTWHGQTFYDIDGNAHYAAQQAKYPYPTKMIEHHNKATVSYLRRKLKTHAVTAKVLFTIPVPAIPHKVFGFSCYPIGTFTETLTTRELQFVLDRGAIHKVYEYAVYDQAKIFTEAVHEIRAKELEAKEAGNEPLRRLYKLMRQGLYGKWAQRGRKMKLLKTVPEYAEDGLVITHAGTDERETYEEFGEEWWEVSTDQVSFNSFPAIGAHITADARLALYNWIELAGWENTYVCDTDGLMVNQTGFDRLQHLIHPSDMGKLKIEKVADNASVTAPKQWSCGDAVRWKGRPKDAEEIAPNRFRFWSTPSLLQQERIEKDGGWLQRQVVRNFLPEYLSGRMGRDGSIIPWTLVTTDGHEYVTNWFIGQVPNTPYIPGRGPDK